MAIKNTSEAMFEMFSKAYNRNQELEFGKLGFDEVTGTESGNWYAFMPVGGAASLSATSLVGDNMSALTLAEGVRVYGRFSTLTVTSGKVLAYRIG